MGPIQGFCFRLTSPLRQPAERCLFLEDPTLGWDQLMRQRGL